MKHAILRIFATGAEQRDLAKQFTVIQSYPGFLLADVPKKDKYPELKGWLYEDITDQYEIRLPDPAHKGRTVKLSNVAAEKAKPFPKGRHHYLVQFVGPIKRSWLSAVTTAGGELREPYGGFTYIVRANEKKARAIRELPIVRWIGHLPYDARIDHSLLHKKRAAKPEDVRQLPRTRQLSGVYTVEFFGPQDLKKAVSSVKKLGFDVLDKNEKARVLIVSHKGKEAQALTGIDKLSRVHGVRRIGERSLPRISNDVAAGIMGTARSMAPVNKKGLNLSGKGEIVAVCDTGIDTGDATHINADFSGRIAFIKSYPITPDYNKYITNPGGDDGAADLDEGHGTHVTGSILGNGTNSAGLSGIVGPIRGLAYNAKLVFQAVEQEMKWKDPANVQKYGRYLLSGIPADLTVVFQYAYQKGARIHSNSWGGGNPGEYDEQCRQLDQFVWGHKDFCVLVAAGNDGTDKDGDGKINPMSVTSPATAKNCITIGACENKRPAFNADVYGKWWPDDYPVAPFKNDPIADDPDEVVPFSSRGPCVGGRIKPDVISPGTFILSVRSSMIAPNNTGWAPLPQSKNYFYMGGTSMATPLSAGAVALLREYLRTKQSITKPSAALIKAALIAGADRLPGMQPSSAVVDNNQGYGRLNLDNILAPANAAAAVFADRPKNLATGDLYTRTFVVKSGGKPLRVVMAYSDYPGENLVNNLNLILTAPDGTKYAGNQAIGGSPTPDSLNNVEAIQVDKAAAGNWKIEVVGSNVPQGPQDFALVCLGNV